MTGLTARRERFGFVPGESFGDGLRRTIDWCRHSIEDRT